LTGEDGSKMKTILRKRQLDIAKSTLKMPNAVLNVMGGMTKKEAKRIRSERFNPIEGLTLLREVKE